jgi:hypothetical protein
MFAFGPVEPVEVDEVVHVDYVEEIVVEEPSNSIVLNKRVERDSDKRPLLYRQPPLLMAVDTYNQLDHCYIEECHFQLVMDEVVVSGTILMDEVVVSGAILMDEVVVSGAILMDEVVVSAISQKRKRKQGKGSSRKRMLSRMDQSVMRTQNKVTRHLLV